MSQLSCLTAPRLPSFVVARLVAARTDGVPGHEINVAVIQHFAVSDTCDPLPRTGDFFPLVVRRMSAQGEEERVARMTVSVRNDSADFLDAIFAYGRLTKY